MTPGNDVMSAILSLLVETLIYGLVIILFVTLLLSTSVSFFSADCPVRTDIYDTKLREYDNLTFTFHSDLDLDDTVFHWWNNRPVIHKMSFPEYFTKRAESMLDICFLVFPTIVVLFILLPTLGFLYNHEFFTEHISTAMSIDVIGHQWYWSYEYRLNKDSDLCDFSFDSILDVDAVENVNLEVDRNVVIPTDVYISITVTSTDVIHSWAVPQLGIKIDAIPGRIANAVLYTFMDGVYYGQCSELCGVLHGFMPICVESVDLDLFFHWVFLNTDLFFGVPVLDFTDAVFGCGLATELCDDECIDEESEEYYDLLSDIISDESFDSSELKSAFFDAFASLDNDFNSDISLEDTDGCMSIEEFLYEYSYPSLDQDMPLDLEYLDLDNNLWWEMADCERWDVFDFDFDSESDSESL